MRGLQLLRSMLLDGLGGFWQHLLQEKKVLERLKGIQLQQSIRYNQYLGELEQALRKECNNVLKQVELFWYQKARTKWLKEEERNTHFFHCSTIIKRRKDKILKLKNNDGEWISDPKTLK